MLSVCETTLIWMTRRVNRRLIHRSKRHAFDTRVMLEKWLLVVVIVGCTSLVFLVCFPLDFYLYRRRKRLARKIANLPFYQPPEVPRTGQIHSRVSIDVSTDSNHGNADKVASPPEGKAGQLGALFRLINLFRRRKTGKPQVSVTTTPEVKTNIPKVTVTQEEQPTTDTKDCSVSPDVAGNTTDNPRQPPCNDNTSIEADRQEFPNIERQTVDDEQVSQNDASIVASIGPQREKANVLESQEKTYKDTHNFSSDGVGNFNNSLTKQKAGMIYSGGKVNQISVTNKHTHSVNIKIKGCAVNDWDKDQAVVSGEESGTDDVSVDFTRDKSTFSDRKGARGEESGSDDDTADIIRDKITLSDQEGDSNIEIIEVRANIADKNYHDAKLDDFPDKNTSSRESMSDLYSQSEQKLDKRFRKLNSELNLKYQNSGSVGTAHGVEPLTIAYSELKLSDDINQHRLELMYNLKGNNSVPPTDEEMDTDDFVGKRKKKKKRSKRLGDSEDPINSKSQRRRKKKSHLQQVTVNSLPEISIHGRSMRENFSGHSDVFG